MVVQNRKIKLGKNGVNYVTQVVDDNNCNFNSIIQENDVGIDGYIEIFDECDAPTGEMLFVQIKTGKSYYNVEKGICSIPVGSHREYWLSIKNKVFGIVCVLDAQEKHIISAYWVDIKRALKQDKTCTQINFSMNRINEFTEESFRKYFLTLTQGKIPEVSYEEAKRLLEGTNKDKEIGTQILCVKYARVRESWELLFAEYHRYREDFDLYFFINAISHAFSHPDHMYVKNCYEFSDESCKYVNEIVNNFTEKDMVYMLEFVDDTGIDRGTIGQSVEIIFEHIKQEKEKLVNIINANHSYYVAQNAEVILAYHFPQFYLEVIDIIETADSQCTEALVEQIKQNGCIYLY